MLLCVFALAANVFALKHVAPIDPGEDLPVLSESASADQMVLITFEVSQDATKVVISPPGITVEDQYRICAEVYAEYLMDEALSYIILKSKLPQIHFRSVELQHGNNYV